MMKDPLSLLSLSSSFFPATTLPPEVILAPPTPPLEEREIANGIPEEGKGRLLELTQEEEVARG